MPSIHEIKAQKALDLLTEVGSFIRSHDVSYQDSVGRQLARVSEVADNLVRYAEAIQERLEIVVKE